MRAALGIRYPSSRAEEERGFDEAAERNDALAFVIGTTGERAGVVEADPIDWHADTVETSFRLHPDHRGVGRAREALSVAVVSAFDDLRA